MKRILGPLLLVLLTTGVATAQKENTHDEDDGEATKVSSGLRIPTGAGNVMVGANLFLARLQFQKGTDAAYSIGLSPKVGFFALPNLALGLNLDLGVEGQKGYRSISYGFTPFARVYFARDNSARERPFQFFFEGGLGFGGVNTHLDGGDNITTNGFRAYALPGVDYFLNHNVAAEAGLQYTFTAGKPDAHVVGLSLGFQIFLGR